MDVLLYALEWGDCAVRMGLDEAATAEEVAVCAGLVLAPGATEYVELRGDVLCYPEDVAEGYLRSFVAAIVGRGSGAFRVAT